MLYDPFGGVRGWTWANGTPEVREYDQDGRVSLVEAAGASSYVYDDADRITAINALSGNPSPSWSYGYDLLDRLATATRPGVTQSFAYDANGNRLSQGGTQSATYTVSSVSNRLQNTAGSLSRNYSYDPMGNITADGPQTFGYNAVGRMTSAGNTLYLHNAHGQRVIKRHWAGNETSYMFDESGRVLEKCHVFLLGQCSSYYSQQYLWLDDIPVAALLPHVKYNWEGYIDHHYVGLYNIHTDHLNTPRRLTTANGSQVSVIWRWDSDPFGTTLPDGNLENDPELEPYVLDLRFPGQLYDSETGLYYNYFRDYDPFTGRYVQSDPIGLEGGINTYAYVENSPVDHSDPLGLKCTARQLVALQLIVNISCKWSGERRCTASDNCDTNRNKIAKNSGCIAARRAINKKCFNGGDVGHRQAVEEAKKALQRCLELRPKCCVGDDCGTAK